MAEYDPSLERYAQAPITRHLDQYRIVCETHEGSWVDLIIAFEKLCGEVGIEPDNETLIFLQTVGILPSAEQFEKDPRQGLELFAMAPLRFLGPYRELNDEQDNPFDLYKETARIALNLCSLHTNEGCLRAAYPWNAEGTSCQYSSVCPRIVVRNLLVEPPIPYNDRLDPLATMLIGDKLVLAVRLGIIEKQVADAILDNYDSKN